MEGSGCDIFCGSVGSGSILLRVQVMSVAASFKQLMVNLVILHPQFKNLRVLVCGGTKQDIGRHIWKTCKAKEGFTFSKSGNTNPLCLPPSCPNTFIRSLNWTHSAAIFSDITVLDPQSDNVCVTCQPPTVSIFSSAHVTLTSM